MRISDWSSDVCSSDLEDRDALLREEAEHAAEEEALRSRRTEADEHADDEAQVDDDGDDADDHPDDEEQNEDRPRRRAPSAGGGQDRTSGVEGRSVDARVDPGGGRV